MTVELHSCEKCAHRHKPAWNCSEKGDLTFRDRLQVELMGCPRYWRP